MGDQMSTRERERGRKPSIRESNLPLIYSLERRGHNRFSLPHLTPTSVKDDYRVGSHAILNAKLI
ncbi:hypothetical protein AXF42_Ash016621 [Apostasia shenzhenica]|uniref:Uncharacterized protein n=1 Tax=Apostasia shenzhenica TaxID=1088818 RepID=A0A2I0A1L4_9ASPA|nr:hypothetical protein AXF42_Ash016621 [Apostasia shenzhenica]